MGNCIPPARPRQNNMYVADSPSFKHTLALFDKSEIDLLKLIYKDLAPRFKDNLITKDSFSDFFNMIGLWSERVFDNFDTHQRNFVSYEEFICGIAYYIKCDEAAKIKHLFQLYDLKGLGGISKPDFQQMIMNYPKEDIKKLLNDPMFLESLNIVKKNDEYNQKKCSQQPKPTLSTQRRQVIQIQPANQMTSQISDKGLQYRDILAISNQNLEIDNRNQTQPSIDRKRFSSVDMLFPSESMVGQNGVPMGGFVCNLSVQVQGQTIEMQRVNLNYLVQRYVDMVFAQKNKENKSMLNLQEFTLIVSQHPNIYNGLYKGFNYDVWGYNSQIKQSRYIFMAKDLDGEMMKQTLDIANQAITSAWSSDKKTRDFLIVSNFVKKEIICLDGLSVKEIIIRHDKKFGFEIFHKDRTYKSKIYFCKDLDTFHNWRDKLQIFEKAVITDHYNLLNVIGEGRFSMVHRGISKKDHNEYAVKVIEKFKLSRSEKLMLSHETEIMKLLNHSCVIKFKENIENKTHLYIITELVGDGDLFDFIQKKRLVSEFDAALIMSQLFDTINYIHTIGIVHKDLKPENIMVIYQPDKKQIKQVKLIDFGFSNFLANLQDSAEANDNICGTPNFMAPEVLEGKPMNFKIDNFALGVIMFKMLSGELPFDSQFPDEIFQNIIECKFEFNQDVWSAVSKDSMDLVSKLLQKDPNDRINLSEAMAHPWIENRKNYKTQDRVQQRNHHTVF